MGSRFHGWVRAITRVVLCGAGLSLTIATTAHAGASKVTTYRPVFHQIATNSDIEAAGNYTLLIPSAVVLQPGTATLIDQATGQHGTIAYGGLGCGAGDLGPTVLFWTCQPSPSYAPTFAMQQLSTGQIATPPPGLEPSDILGSQWEQQPVQAPGNEYNPTYKAFVNLDTGRTVADTSRIGGSTYPDLNDPALFRTACSPVTMPSSYDSYAKTVVPGSLFFFGSVAVGTNQTGGGLLRVQRCGSTQILDIHAGLQTVHNRHIFLWEHPLAVPRQLDGIVPSTDRRFTIPIPQRVDTASDLIALNNRTIYLGPGPDSEADANGAKEWAVNIPAPLR
jgi:hypothetical protein